MQENRDNRNEVNENSPYNEQVNAGEAGGIITEYIVEEKDTLPEIAQRYGVSLEEIIAANEHIKNRADMVEPGLRIMIPKKMG